MFRTGARYTRLTTFFPRRHVKDPAHRKWQPPALRIVILLPTALLCLGTIALLQVLLVRSQKEGGLAFAERREDFSLGTTFAHFYLPTILAVIFSIHLAWIDLEVKRCESYFQLSREDGALGRESLLLQYPFNFLPTVPVTALRRGHWSVFFISIGFLLTSWGIVPTQAGIFSVRKIERTVPVVFNVTHGSINTTQTNAMNLQEANLGFGFAQSVYGILTLNETLPPFMDRDYALVPFNRIPGEPGHGEKWTANTTLYSVDLNCEEAMQSEGLSERSVPMYEIRYTRFNDSHSFSYEIEEADDWDVIGTQVPGLDVFNEIRETNRSKVISYTSFDVIKQYTAVYGGLEQYTDYHSVVTNMIQRPLMSNNTIVSWYPDNPNPRIPTFFAGFYKNRESVTQPHNRKTGIFCNTQYYAQVVQATVDAFSGRPLNVVPLSPKRTFDATILDTEKFEENLTRGLPWQVIRSRKLPEKKFPTYMDRFVSSNLSYPNGKFDTHPMAILATIAGGSSLDMYLDPQKLQESHEAGFRLLFCRAMIDVLNSSTRLNSTIVAGSSSVTSEAVVVEPIFVYVVEGMLGALSSLLLLLTYQTTRRNIHLQTDPGTVAAAMSLVAENRTLLSRLSRADHMGEHFLQRELEGLRYKLCANGQYIRLHEMWEAQNELASPSAESPKTSLLIAPRDDCGIEKPIRPAEFGLFVLLLAFGVFIMMAVALAILYAKSVPYGLPMPSKDPVIQALVENYLPTAVATLIEPFWLSINRLLCQLQPYEELQTPASAKRSLFLNYSSLPPQLTVLKAVRSGHLPLAVVCLMTLLANLLAIAFSGLFSHELRTIPSSAQFNPPLAAKVTFINGTYGPADGMSYRGGASMAGSFAKYNETGAFYGGRGEEQFLAAESHYQRGTPLPSWTDESLLYLPFMSSSPDGNTRIKYRARTKAFGAKLECENIVASPPDGNSKASIFSWSVNADLKQKQRNGSVVDCRVGTGDPSTAGDNGIITRNHKAHEMSVGCDTRKMAVELFYFPEAPSYYAMGRDILPTYAEIEACMPIVVFGWGRKTKYDCDQAEGYFLKCSQRVVVGDATVVVDSRGQLQEKVADFEPDRRGQETVDEYFSNNFENIFGQSNKYIFKKPDNTKYHNDSFASDSINYFMDRVADNSSHLDPNAPLPDFDITERLSKAYSQLFAIWLGVNKEKLFLPVAEGTTTEGMEFRDEERVVISKPLFIVSEIILWTYALVTAIVYFRRPGKYLPRMPTSIASVVTLFAASAAVEDFKGKLHLEDTECAELLGGQKYAFGSYVGRDGKVHVGVEKLPFVVPNEGRTYAVIEDGSLGRKQWARTSNGS